MELEKQKIVVFTPSRRVGGKRVVCYDDRFIVKLAYESDGVIVSNDTYRDLQGERPEWKKCIEERLLMYSFVNDKFMPPDDPLGRHGPSLDNFLRKKPLPAQQKKQLCPYDKKCTYGIKCKFYHPERANQSYLSLADELREKAQIHSGKEERSAKSSPRQPQSNHESARNVSPRPRDAQLPRDQQSSSISENPRTSPNHAPVAGGHCQNEWAGLHLMPGHYYANMSHEYLDSGFGSAESHFSDVSRSLHVRRQHPNALPGHQHASAHLEENNASQPCRCCSRPQAQQNENMNCKSLPVYDTYPPHMLPHGVPHQHSLPCHVHYSGAPHLQQNYWFDSFQGFPPARTTGSLPSVVHSSHVHGSCCSHKCHQYQSWSQRQPPPVAFDPQRSELRKKLQAIFHPGQVDMVMEMFPHLMDAEKLAAKIISLKAPGGM